MTEGYVAENSKTQGKTSKRMYFLDNLKAFIILLMVAFHVGLGYMDPQIEWWYVNDTLKNSLFNLFVLETDVYIMPIMFMLAGYFTIPVLNKRGIKEFWRDKLWRIVLPWIGGSLLVAPLIAYSIIFSRTPTPPNYFSFWGNEFWGAFFQQAHFWFLGILALFFLLLTFVYQQNPQYFKKPAQVKMPSKWFFSLFALISALPFFLANLIFPADLWYTKLYIFCFQPVRLGLLACYFVLGVYAWKNAWFTGDGYNPKVLGWSIGAIVMLVVFLYYRITFTFAPNVLPLFKAGHALTFSVFCLTTTFAGIAVFHKFIDSDAYLWRRLAANSYIIYFIHQCIVIPLAYTVQQLQMNIWLKYFGVAITSLVLCFLVAEYIITPILSLGKKDSKSRIVS